MKKKELIKELIVNFQQSLPASVIQRNLQLPLHTGKIITVPGVRRCGKSSLFSLAINQLLSEGIEREKILFLNFDDERLSFSSEDFDEILQAYRELYPNEKMAEVYFFFDEIQMTSNWEQFVRRVYDSVSKQIFLTGSNSRMLSSEIATSLRGRTLQFEEFPLSFDEYCHFKDIDTNYYNTSSRAKIINAFYEYLKFGAFPEIVLGDAIYREKILQEYFFVMLYKDLIERYDIRNSSPVRYFIKRMMLNITKPTSINKIYNELKSQGVSVAKNTLYELADQTEAIYLLLSLPKFDFSLIKESNTNKKYYCIDNGLRNAVLTPHSDDAGILLENLVFIHLRRKYSFQKGIYYFKEKKECDFVLTDHSEVIELIQVAWQIDDLDTRNREIAGLIEASNTTNCNKLSIITAETEDEIVVEDRNIRVIPAWKWLLDDVKEIPQPLHF